MKEKTQGTGGLPAHETPQPHVRLVLYLELELDLPTSYKEDPGSYAREH